ncbi:GNAT family N-acetyltransferase [Chitinophaga sp. G-6-1-13]|uniref:GNAT family N-acetyltransferase n=1 Tax=Chitinophaga fulva TaxID=2728842 RepID=A0A848GS12_9BACT|nr:GNAT family N-acetyltransferase [Chitinophaga fulva]NML40817.1 GNAT family N-acetyltransferase [Chitinophaga fulva]
MKYNIKGKTYTYIADIKDNNPVRLSFDQLSVQTFHLSFEPWHHNGYWDHTCVPHVLLDGDTVIANATVNVLRVRWQEEEKTWLQLGTVMTHPDYRHQGLSRWLMDKIFEEWEGQYNLMFLFANERVLDFYPKFGFVPVSEYQYHTRQLTPQPGKVRQLDMDNAADCALLLRKYAQSNPFAALTVTDPAGLLMFYCTQFMKTCVYHLEETDVIAVVEHKEGVMTCHDIFGETHQSLNNILSVLMEKNTQQITLGFTPKDTSGFTMLPLKTEDLTLFVLEEQQHLFADNQLMIPTLAHT